MIKISSFTPKFLSGFYGTGYLCVWDGGATTGVRCVWWWGGEGGREGMLFFNCFGQLSKSKLQQMEVKFKTEWGRCEKGNQNKTIELVLLKFSSGDQSCVSAPVTTGLESIFVCVCVGARSHVCVCPTAPCKSAQITQPETGKVAFFFLPETTGAIRLQTVVSTCPVW